MLIKMRLLKGFDSIVVEYGFHNKTIILNAPLVSCPIPLWVRLLLHPPKADDWNWATDQRCIQNKLLVMKSIL